MTPKECKRLKQEQAKVFKAGQACALAQNTYPEVMALYEKHKRSWINIAASLLNKDRERAREVVQAVMAELCAKGLDVLRMDENPESWIRQRIVWHIKRFIWLSPENAHQIHWLCDSLYAGNDKGHPEPLKDETNTTRGRKLMKAFRSLDVVAQDIIIMKVFRKMSFREIHLTLGFPKETVVNRKVVKRYMRGLQRLKVMLERVGISGQPSSDNRKHAISQSAASRAELVRRASRTGTHRRALLTAGSGLK